MGTQMHCPEGQDGLQKWPDVAANNDLLIICFPFVMSFYDVTLCGEVFRGGTYVLY